MKYLYACSAILATLTFGQEARCETDPWNGPYTGLTLGYESGSAKIATSGAGVGFLSSQSNTIAFKGPGVDLVAGWAKTFNKYYLGLEASASIYSSQGSSNNSFVDGLANITNNLKTKITKNNSFGLVMRGGYKINEKMLLYVKAGAVSTKFNFKTTNSNTGDLNANFSRKSRKRVTGVVGGLGTEFTLTERLIGRLEATHIEYNKFSLSGNDAKITRVRAKPQSNEIKAGIILPIKWK
ncbi:MAG: porin family protein [Alphaproteobacteria bacterium]|nr:porin family protein [Alphaproteobacteria bacterium]